MRPNHPKAPPKAQLVSLDGKRRGKRNKIKQTFTSDSHIGQDLEGRMRMAIKGMESRLHGPEAKPGRSQEDVPLRGEKNKNIGDMEGPDP